MSTYGNQPQEIFDKALHVNDLTTEYNAVLKTYFPKQDGLFMCMRCEWVQKTNDKCEACGTPNFRRVNKTTRIYPVSKGPVAHFMKRVTMCWNEDVDPNNPNKVAYHPYDEKTRLVVNISTAEAHQETYCATCGRVYGWPSGRAATAQEIEDAKNGKIPLKTIKPVASEVDSS
jgi:hypothetical protein